MADLFGGKAANKKRDQEYSARDIEVLEGLEPVRRRPGMYIGGTDERAMHHLVAEVLDNAMDEAVAGHASKIELHLGAEDTVTIRDNGRGIPIDKHPKYPGKSALEVIMTMLHSGGKFSDKVYQTSGGLHGVGISVVNALSEEMTVEIARDKELYVQTYSRGEPTSKLKKAGSVNRRGTSIVFRPDVNIFGSKSHYRPETLYRLARSKAYLFRGVEIHWSCEADLVKGDEATPATAVLHFPGGLADFLSGALAERETLTPQMFSGQTDLPNKAGKLEWAITWPEDGEGFCHSYCNTIPTPQGGTHEAGMRSGLLRGLRAYGEMVNNKRTTSITGSEAFDDAAVVLSLFIREPQFQGQTKEKLATADATKWVEQVIKDHFDHWLTADKTASNLLLEALINRAEERARTAQQKDMARKTATRKLRLPGKLADCSRSTPEGTELFLVEGDSAGGSAKQARSRETQAILPLRGKILNVASATSEKMRANQELADLVQALGCGMGAGFALDKLRYERIIIMTDADVDGAHIASLLMTFFYKEMPGLIAAGKLFLAQPPLYRLSHGDKIFYARNETHRDELIKKEFNNKKVDISRFKGLGEMMPAQLRDTTMLPSKRSLLRVVVPKTGGGAESNKEIKATEDLVESLMGRKAELRFQFIQENAQFARELDV
jgi:topoisomerase IV subunit B